MSIENILPNGEQMDRLIKAHEDGAPTQARIAAALERIAELQASIAAGSAGADFIDATFRTALDGTNTTAVLREWWPMAAGDTPDKYERLARFATMTAQAWDGKVYTVRGYSAATADSAMTALDDLAPLGKAVLATDVAPGGADWAEEDPMTWYVRANAISKQDGTMDVQAVEGIDPDFDVTGEKAPVYCFALALWRRVVRDGSYTTKSWRTTPAADFRPYAGDVAPDNTKRALTWHPAFDGGLNSKGNLTSGAGRAVRNFTSATAGLADVRKWNKYEGLWCDCDTEWLLDMWQLRHQNKENSSILEGCSTYNFQYQVAAAENGVTRVLLAANQAANLVVGSTVSIGDHSVNSNWDRGKADRRNLADKGRITSIAEVSVGEQTYTAINLDLPAAIDVPDTSWLSTMPWHTGSTERVPGHKDGCLGNLTNGKYPLRVAGVEAMVGAYALGLDPLYNVVPGSDSTHWTYDKVAVCRDSEKLAATIGEGYEETGITFTDMPQGWQYVKEFVANDDGVVFPEIIGGSTTQWYKSAFYGSYGAGVRCPWRFAVLDVGGHAGLAAENGNAAPGDASWSGVPRLSGSGKKRGEWPA